MEKQILMQQQDDWKTREAYQSIRNHTTSLKLQVASFEKSTKQALNALSLRLLKLESTLQHLNKAFEESDKTRE